MPAPLRFHFDFSSPYGYLASERIESLAARHERAVDWRPMLLGAAFKVAGTQPLTSIPLKGDYARRDMPRTARFYGAAEAIAAQTGLHRDPTDDAFLRPRVAEAMRALGDEAFSAEEHGGRAIPRDEIVEEARAWLEEPATR